MKIRIWSKNLEKYLPNDEWYINSQGEVFFEDLMDGGLIKSKDNHIVQRFTELHDIYGSPLYEGDIVKLYYYHENIVGESYTIHYLNGKWMLDDCNMLTDYYLDNKKWGDSCKVVKIGNIYEKQLDSF